MTTYALPWITGGSHCEVYWLYEDNKWDPKPYVRACQFPGTETRLEYTAKKFAQTGRLPSEKGHWRQGPPPQNKLYEFKDGPSGMRLLAFSYNPLPGVCWFIVALGAIKDRNDIRPEEAQRALQRRQRFLDEHQPTGQSEQAPTAAGSRPRRR
jgi:hypothetical protein